MKKVWCLIFICLLLCGCVKEEAPIEPIPEPIVEKKEYYVNPESNSRPISVMINNHVAARPYHSGLQDAYLVYEMLVEGGITRLMAIYKDQTTERIGSVRSSRHTYLDYVLENDAIHVHFGWSNIAQEQIPKLGVNNINGLYDGGFWRDKTLKVAYEHTAFTNMEKIQTQISSKNYRNTSEKKLLLNYDLDELDISKKSGSLKADQVKLVFSYSNTTSFIYDSENLVYKRFINNKAHTDYVTKEQYTAKNIIVTKIKNYTVDAGGHQELDNIKSGEGYFITNGYAVPIIWSKSSREAQTIYSYLDGREIVVNNGNTHIEIVPLNDDSIHISEFEVAQNS